MKKFVIIWLVLNLTTMFVAVNFTVGGEPEVAGPFYIAFSISFPLSIVALILLLVKKNKEKA